MRINNQSLHFLAAQYFGQLRLNFLDLLLSWIWNMAEEYLKVG